MISIEEEVQNLMSFLSQSAGFDVGMGGILSIRPVNVYPPDFNPLNWEVQWEEEDEHVIFEYTKEFSFLRDAVQFFVEKRRYLCEGLDFWALDYQETYENPIKVEIK